MSTNIQGRSLMTTNAINNRCTWKAKSKQRSSGTEQRELFFNASSSSHNIYYSQFSGQSRLLQKSTESNKPGKPDKSIWLNVFGQADSLKVSVSSIKSYTKDVCSNIWVSLADREDPIQVRNSISEIQDLIFGGK